MEVPSGTLEAILGSVASAVRPVLRDMLDEAIAEVLPEHVRRATSKPYYTVAEAMDVTGLSKRKLEYMRERREIAFVKRGRLVLFPAEAVHEYLDAGLVPARPRRAGATP